MTTRETPEKGNGRERVHINIDVSALNNRREEVLSNILSQLPQVPPHAIENMIRASILSSFADEFDNFSEEAFIVPSLDADEEFHTATLLQTPAVIENSALPWQTHYIINLDGQIFDIVSDVLDDIVTMIAVNSLSDDEEEI